MLIASLPVLYVQNSMYYNVYNKSYLERKVSYIYYHKNILYCKIKNSIIRRSKTLNHGEIYNMKYRFSTDNSVANVTDISPSMF